MSHLGGRWSSHHGRLAGRADRDRREHIRQRHMTVGRQGQSLVHRTDSPGVSRSCSICGFTPTLDRIVSIPQALGHAAALEQAHDGRCASLFRIVERCPVDRAAASRSRPPSTTAQMATATSRRDRIPTARTRRSGPDRPRSARGPLLEGCRELTRGRESIRRFSGERLADHAIQVLRESLTVPQQRWHRLVQELG